MSFSGSAQAGRLEKVTRILLVGDDFELTLLVYWISAHSIVLSPVSSLCPEPSGLIAKCLSSHLKSDRLYCLHDCRG